MDGGRWDCRTLGTADRIRAATFGDKTCLRAQNAAAEVGWLSSRPEYWQPSESELSQEALYGVTCLSFGLGASGLAWLNRLEQSGWFAGLEPRAEDLSFAGCVPRGHWVTSTGKGSREGGSLAAEVEDFFASASLPSAWYATIAVSRQCWSAERSTVLGLVRALQRRCDPRGRQLTVMVSVEAASFAENGFLDRLLDLGAFVIRAGDGAVAGDHLHHFPLRAVTAPRKGRLVCADLSDYLHTWQRGCIGDLYLIPSTFDEATRTLNGMSIPGNACALNIGFHSDLETRCDHLMHLDRIVARCRDRFPGPDGEIVFTTTDRLDGKTGSADLLVIRDRGLIRR